jgi:general secretion pathway protein G
MSTHSPLIVSSPPPRRGFTLVELMIVIAILGLLAAIVMPRLTDASQQARQTGINAQLQTIRRQIELYKAQHEETIPDVTTSWDVMLQGVTVGNPPTEIGPYLQVTPLNPLNNRSNVMDGDGSGSAGAPCGFIYDYQGGGGTGKLLATDKDGLTPLSY